MERAAKRLVDEVKVSGLLRRSKFICIVSGFRMYSSRREQIEGIVAEIEGIVAENKALSAEVDRLLSEAEEKMAEMGAQEERLLDFNRRLSDKDRERKG